MLRKGGEICFKMLFLSFTFLSFFSFPYKKFTSLKVEINFVFSYPVCFILFNSCYYWSSKLFLLQNKTFHYVKYIYSIRILFYRSSTLEQFFLAVIQIHLVSVDFPKLPLSKKCKPILELSLSLFFSCPFCYIKVSCYGQWVFMLEDSWNMTWAKKNNL